MAHPTIFKLYTEPTTIMKNGYKLIQTIAKLLATELTAITHMIETYKQAK